MNAVDTRSLGQLSLTGKYAVVTAGTQGLDVAIVHLFADRDAAGIRICGHSAANGERVRAAPEAKGTHAVSGASIRWYMPPQSATAGASGIPASSCSIRSSPSKSARRFS